jgi:putative hydrolase of the HAD superfamily
MVRAVTFDGWGTVFLDSPAADEAYRRRRLAGIEAVLAASGVRTTAEALDRAYDAAIRHVLSFWRDCRDIPVAGHVTALLEALEPDLPARLGPAALDDLVAAYARPALAVPPAVDRTAPAALEALAARGCALGLISNVMRTPGSVLRLVLERYGLLRWFAVATFSDECGIRKPAPEIFHRTLRELGVAAREAVHVGDDPLLDVEGAREAGMRVIQVTSSGRATGPVKPDAVVSRLGDLPAALAGLGW